MNKPMSECERLQFSISSSFENVAALAERVSTVCSGRFANDGDAAEMLRLCLAEALNNIVEHAYDGAEGKPIYANVALSRGAYEVTLIDEGKPMPGGMVPEGSGPEFNEDVLEDLPEGGFGWMLIRSEMDNIAYERREGCNVLRLEKYLET